MYNFVRSFDAVPPNEFDGKKVIDSYVTYNGDEFLAEIFYTEDYERYEFGRVENDNETFTCIFRNKRKANEEEIKKLEKEIERRKKEKERTKKEMEILRAFGRSQMCGDNK